MIRYLIFGGVFAVGSLLAWDITEQEDTSEKDAYEQRLQERMFYERKNTELPYFLDAKKIQEKKEAQGWDWDERD